MQLSMFQLRKNLFGIREGLLKRMDKRVLITGHSRPTGCSSRWLRMHKNEQHVLGVDKLMANNNKP